MSGDGQPSSSQPRASVKAFSIRLDGLRPIPARKTPCAAGCRLLRAVYSSSNSSSSSIAEADIDTLQPVSRRVRPPWMSFWGWGNVLARPRVSFCAAFSMWSRSQTRRPVLSKAVAWFNFRTCNQYFFCFDAVIGRRAASENRKYWCIQTRPTDQRIMKEQWDTRMLLCFWLLVIRLL